MLEMNSTKVSQYVCSKCHIVLGHKMKTGDAVLDLTADSGNAAGP